MANNQTDVELRIRATNYSRKTTTEVVDALKDMRKAQDAQIESAKKGTTSAAALEKSYGQMAKAIEALVSQQSTIKLFQQQSTALNELKSNLDAASRAQADYAKYVAASGAKTPAQVKAMKEQAAVVKDLETQLGRMQGRLNTTASALNEYGINSGNLADKQRQIVSAVTASNAALARQEAALDNADGFAKQRRDAEALLVQRQAQVRADVAFERAARAAAAAIEAQNRAQRESAAAAAFADVQHQAEMEALFTREANKRTAAIQAQAQAMRTAAEAAERMVRQSATNARAPAPVAQTSNVAGAVRDIQRPAEAALQTVAGLEAAIGSLGARVAAIRGPVQNYSATLRDATQAQAALSAIAGQVDAYNRQIASLRAARQAYVENRTAVNALIAEMRSGAAGEDITTRLRQAQSTLASSATQLSNISASARTARNALRDAGVDTRNMTAAEAALVDQATRATRSMNQLTDAFRRNGAAADSSGSRIFNWFGGAGGRTTLSYTQRLRGELLGLAAGFVGLNAAIQLGRKSLEAYSANQAIMSRLTIVNGGDSRKAAEDFKYLQEQADRIGFVFQEVAPAYTKFAIAMKAAGFTTDQTRFSFENIAGSAVKAKLSTDELTGILKAFEQMASKGKIQAEELRGQLGDRLPGAFQIAAKAAGKTVEEYTKMMELGQVGSEQVINIARELGKTYGASEAAAATLLQSQARFENAQNRFLNSTAEGGFVQAYQTFLERMTRLLDDGQLDKFATLVSKAFVLVIDVLEAVVENIGFVTVAIEGLIALKLISWLAGMPALFRAFTAEVVILNGVLLTMQSRLAAAGAAAALSQALGATGLTGVLVRLAPALIAVGNGLLFVARSLPIIGAAIAAYQVTSAILDKVDDSVRGRVTKAIRDTNKAVAEAQSARRVLDNAKTDQERKDAQEHYDKMRNLAVAAVNRQAKEVQAAKDKGVNVEEIAAGLPAASPKNTATADPGDPDGGPRALAALKAELDKEAKVTERQAQNQRLKAAKGDLAARMDLIDQEYDARREVAKTQFKDAKELANALELIDRASLAKQAVERAKYNNEQAKQGESAGKKRIAIAENIAAKLEEIEDDIKKRSAEQNDATEPYETRRKARIDAIAHAYDELDKQIRKQAGYDKGAAAKSSAQLAVLTAQRQAIEGQNSDREEAVRLEKEFTALQDIQKSKLDQVNTLYETGRISLAQQTEQMNAVIAETGPGIEAAGKKALDFANSVRAMLDPVVFQRMTASIGSGMAKASVDSATATNNLALTQEQLNVTLDAQAAAIERITTMRKLGILTSEQEAAMLNQSAEDYKVKLLDITAALLAQLQAMRDLGQISEETYAKQAAGIEQLQLGSQNALQATTELDDTIVNSLSSNASSAFGKLGDEIGKVATGAESIGDGFRNALSAVGEFFASLLRDIAMAIAKQLILNAIAGFGGGIGAGAVKLGGVAAGGNHNGGVVGRTRSFTRTVDPAMFAGAQRFHDGGLPGLRADEVPTILQKGEEVLRKSDPRNVMNAGGLGGGGGGGDSGGQRFVLVDDRSKVAEAMQSAEGEKVTMIHLRRNLPTLRQLLK